jgi:D-alanyl-D-alanine carboxypeptidase/D-alanyl-D-alanine endopeptidase (penicillin-binding protein 7)
MRIRAAGKSATMVLLNAGTSSVRIADALKIRRMVAGRDAPKASARKVVRRKSAARKKRRR